MTIFESIKHWWMDLVDPLPPGPPPAPDPTAWRLAAKRDIASYRTHLEQLQALAAHATDVETTWIALTYAYADLSMIELAVESPDGEKHPIQQGLRRVGSALARARETFPLGKFERLSRSISSEELQRGHELAAWVRAEVGRTAEWGKEGAALKRVAARLAMRARIAA